MNRFSPSFFSCIVTICLFTFFQFASAQYGNIDHYQRFYGVGNYNNQSIAIIRSYQSGPGQFYIGVGFDDMKTRIIPSRQIRLSVKSWHDILVAYTSTPYIAAVKAAIEQSHSLQDAGIQHAYPKDKGIALTVDLCPSHKPLDRVIFTSLLAEFEKIEKPVPVGLSITGRFLNSHPKDIAWLKKLEQSGDLEITWIDHTYNHLYNKGLPLPENFLLEPGTNLDVEILELEKALLKNEILFSAFFRFPGLVSDSHLVEQVTDYGLIPVGSDAWLAKGQKAHDGDIVLIHGNGNEPLGVKDFIRLLGKEKDAVMQKQWLLYDLRENMEAEFDKK